MQYWTALQKGDIVDVVAPSFPVGKEDISQATHYLESLGLKPRIPKDIIGKDLLCANTDIFRLKHLVDAMTSPDSRAIWCLRGGYGAAQLLGGLRQLTPHPLRPKLLIGYSDATALHLFTERHWGWPTLHAPTLIQCAKEQVAEASRKKLEQLLFGRTKALSYPLTPLNEAAENAADFHAPVTGGNMSLVQTSIGTHWKVQAKGKILFMEEVDERGYRIDRMLTHMKQSGVFEEVKGLLFGEFTGDEEKDGKPLAWPVIKRFATGMNIPAWHVKGIGHTDTNNPLPLGVRAHISGIEEEKPKLTIAL